MKKKTGNKMNRRYKDRLFYALFGSEERKRLSWSTNCSICV